MTISVERWLAAWRELGVLELDPAVYPILIDRYCEPHRKYHTLQHLDECFEKFSELRNLGSRPAEIELAIWFHDAIYDTSRQDNEERSAEWARATLENANVPGKITERIFSLIISTQHGSMPSDNDAAILADVDLSILGADITRFEEYERQIREEYSFVPTYVFLAKRKEILLNILDWPRIYTTSTFFERYEQQARINIKSSLSCK